MALISYVLRQFFKAVEADPFVLVEVRSPLFLPHSLAIEGLSDYFFSCAQAFFPKNRNRWKKYSSLEPESKTKAKEVEARFPPDVQVKKGFTWSEQLAIAMAALQEAGQSELIEWVKEVCLARTGKCPK